MQTHTRQQQKGMWKDAESENELKIPHVQILLSMFPYYPLNKWLNHIASG